MYLGLHGMSEAEGPVLLVTAHPDDECMFFTPTIRNFIEMGREVDLICLSTGNYDGLGHIRRRELEKSARILGISTLSIIDDTELKDGPESIWKAEIINNHIDSLKTRYSIIITFDDKGVSGHPNHCAISKALKDRANSWRLKSLPVWLKYLGPLGCWLASLLYTDGYERYELSFRDAYSYGYIAMKQHESQLVWFRRLYLIFSVYMTSNLLTKRRRQ